MSIKIPQSPELTQAPMLENAETFKPSLPAAIEVITDQGDPKLFVGDMCLPVRDVPTDPTLSVLIPKGKQFEGFVQDQATVKTILNIVSGVQSGFSVLLEGPTATSKTSGILYLAHLTNTPVHRLNLNGQTNTAELIGKYVPNNGECQIDFLEEYQADRISNDQAKSIIAPASDEKRVLSLYENQLVANILEITIPEWKWQDGIIPKAMQQGAWVILDEVNLASPEVLERLNSVLETPASLVVSEGNNNAVEVNSGFRMFATQNPSEYEGRQELSPAFKNRWQSYILAGPNESSWHSMLDLWVFGRQPKIELYGEVYQAPEAQAIYPSLAKVPEMEKFIALFAKFFHTLVEKTKANDPNRINAVYTRRDIQRFMNQLVTTQLYSRSRGGQFEKQTIETHPTKIIFRVLSELFLENLSGEDRAKVQTILDAVGLSEANFPELIKVDELKKKMKNSQRRLFLNELKTLTVAQVRELMKLPNLESIHLSGLTSLSQEVAQELAGLSRVWYLELNELKTLTVAQVRELIKLLNLENLHLNGLTSLSKEVAHELAKLSNLQDLQLNGLTSLSKEVAQELAQISGLRILTLDGVTSLSQEVAQELVNLSSLLRLNLNGLTSLSQEVAGELAQISIFTRLNLNGLNFKSKEVAQENPRLRKMLGN